MVVMHSRKLSDHCSSFSFLSVLYCVLYFKLWFVLHVLSRKLESISLDEFPQLTLIAFKQRETLRKPWWKIHIA